jgi:hypothetical protein
MARNMLYKCIEIQRGDAPVRFTVGGGSSMVGKAWCSSMKQMDTRSAVDVI